MLHRLVIKLNVLFQAANGDELAGSNLSPSRTMQRSRRPRWQCLESVS